MKIAFLSFYSGIVNRGVETFVDSLATQLAKSNEIILYQSGKAQGKENYSIITKTVTIPKVWENDTLPPQHLLKRLFLNDRKRVEFLFTLKCIRKLYKQKPDIIFPLNSGWQALICRFLSIFTKSKFVVAGQSGRGWDDRWLLLLKPDCFVALSQTQANWAKKTAFWKDTQIKIIPNGVDLDKFSSKNKPLNMTLSKPIILTVAAPIPSKRIETTIRAVARLEKSSLLLIGSGYQNDFIDSLGNKILGKNRYQRLSVNHQHMPSLYATADLFTLCSDISEAFGIAYIEALATNLPCVATDDSLRREIIGHAGLFIKDPKDEIEYSKKIRTALKTNWGNKPITQARQFSWENIALKYSHLFQQILAIGN